MRVAVASHTRCTNPEVLGDDGIGGQERDALDHRLSDKDAIERVLMDRRQPVEGNGVLAGDRQFAIVVVEQAAAQEPGINPKVVPLQAALDGHFPEAGGAEEQLIARIVEQRARAVRQPVGLTGSP